MPLILLTLLIGWFSVGVQDSPRLPPTVNEGTASTNVLSTSPAASLGVPLDDWKYGAVERIVLSYGINYPVNSRPMSRLEMARIVRLALYIKKELAADDQSEDESDHIESLLHRLSDELDDTLKMLDGSGNERTLDIRKSVTFEGAYGGGDIVRENNFGDPMGKGLHSRIIPEVGIERGMLAANVAPRIRLDSDVRKNEDIDFLRSYLKVEGKILGLEAGKNSMWWGPGRNGAWLMTGNATPFSKLRLYNPTPYSIPFLGEFKFNIFHGRTSEQLLSYKKDGVTKSRYEKPHFGGVRFDFVQSRFLEIGMSMVAMFAGRDGLSADDVKEVFLPGEGAVNRETEGGPVTNRIASLEWTFNFKSPFRSVKGMKLYCDYGGEDLSNVDKDLGVIQPRIMDVSTLFGFYMDTGTTDFRVEYTQNYEGENTLWYSNYNFSDGYRHRGDIIGHHIGGAVESVYLKLTHPLNEFMIATVDYEYLSRKNRYGNIPGRKDELSLGLDYFGDDWQTTIVYEYEENESPKKRDTNHMVLVNYKKTF